MQVSVVNAFTLIRRPCGPVAAILIVLLAGGPAACRQARAPVVSRQLQPGDEPWALRVLSPAEQDRALAEMRAVAGYHEPVGPPRPAPHGLRFEDVPAAVGIACGATETAIFGRESGDDRHVFLLRDIRDRPGRLVVVRRDDRRVYDAEITIGRFGGAVMEERRFLRELETAMRGLGKKRRFEETPAAQP